MKTPMTPLTKMSVAVITGRSPAGQGRLKVVAEANLTPEAVPLAGLRIRRFRGGGLRVAAGPQQLYGV